MDGKRQALTRLSEIFSEASQLFKVLADMEEHGAPSDDFLHSESQIRAQSNEAVSSEASHAASNEERATGGLTRKLLEEKGLVIQNIAQIPPQAEGLLTLAGVMGQKYKTIRPFLSHIKKAQSSRRSISLDLSKFSQETIADITLVANLANQAGLLPNYRYLKSPRYKLFADAPVSPLAINFFTGEWLELFALKAVRDFAMRAGLEVYPLSHVGVVLPNGDQFELDLVFTLGADLAWVEAKTGNDFERLLPKYRAISEMICSSQRDAILLWSNYDKSNSMLSARGVLARMTLCAPDEFPVYISGLFTAGVQQRDDETELA